MESFNVVRAQAIRALGQKIIDDQHELSTPWLKDIVFGVLRLKGRLEFILESYALKKKPSGWLKRALLVGSYQILYQDRVSLPHVINETVELIKEKEGQAPAQFANAVLRKIAAQKEFWLNPQKKSDTNLNELEQAHFWSLPVWIWQRFVKAYGMTQAELIAESLLLRPKIWLRDKKVGAVCLEERESLEDLISFQSGEAFVQDLSSQKLVQWVTQRLKPQIKILDLCASPGGKSIGLSWNGFKVFSTDESKDREMRLRENLMRFSPQVLLVPWQEVFEKIRLGEFNAVWIDAPCTGSGILRRHPEIRWRKTEKDLNALVQIQAQLLTRVLENIKISGKPCVLIYSVCSLFKEEGSDQIKKIKDQFKTLEELTLFPYDERNPDGFYGAILS